TVMLDALRLAANHRRREDPRAATDRREPGDDHMRQQLDIVPENDLRANVAERANHDVFTDHRSVFNDRERMDPGTGGNHWLATSLLTIIAPISASATSFPSTFASQ